MLALILAATVAAEQPVLRYIPKHEDSRCDPFRSASKVTPAGEYTVLVKIEKKRLPSR